MSGNSSTCSSCAARSGSQGNPFSVHSTNQQAPSYSHWPDAQSNQSMISGNKLMSHYNSTTPFIYAKQSQGAPSHNGPMRYDQQDGWINPTFPCAGAKPSACGEKALCDVHTGKYYCPTTSQNGSFYGTLVNMAPCAIDRNNPPIAGTTGQAQCDRLTGQYYYDGADGIFHQYDGQSLAAFSSYQKSGKGLSSARGGLANSSIRYGQPSVELSRAYTGSAGSGVKFHDQSTGRLHPALTNMGSDRARGHYQNNSQIKPSMTMVAKPPANSQQPRGGYMSTSRVKATKFSSEPFSQGDYNLAQQIAQRPSLITQSQITKQHNRSTKTTLGGFN